MRNGLVLSVVAVCLLSAGIASADTYQFTGVPQASEIRGVNASGTLMVGETPDGNALLWDTGTISTFSAPGARYTELMGVNDSGQIAGCSCYPNQAYYRSFTTSVSSFGAMNPFAVAGADNTVAMGNNNSGAIVGYYTWTTGTAGFLRHADGTYETLAYPGAGSQSWARGVNGAGTTVGSWRNAADHGWIRDTAGAFTNFDMAGASGTNLAGVNDLGQMVGNWLDGAGNWHGFVRDALGNVQTIVFPGATQTNVIDISNTGMVVGAYQRADGGWEGFYASPVPLPAALPAGLAAMAGLAGIRGWRRQGRRVAGRLQGYLRRVFPAILVAGLLATRASGGAIVNLGLPAGDTGASYATAINNQNVVVGYSDTGDAFRWSAATGTQGLPGQDHTHFYAYRPHAINDQGTIAISNGQSCVITNGDGQYEGVFSGLADGINSPGVVVGCDGNSHAVKVERQYVYVYVGGGQYQWQWQWQWQATRLGVGWSNMSVATAINDSGMIVGTWGNRAMRYTDAAGTQDLGAGDGSQALSLNSSGVIVGYWSPNGSNLAFRYSDSLGLQALPCPYPDYSSSVARAVNDSGVIVGQSSGSGKPFRAMLWDAQGSPLDLNTWLGSADPAARAHWFLSDAVDINNNGMVVGWGYYGDGSAGGSNDIRAFVLDTSAVPLPAALPAGLGAMAGLAGIGAWRRSR